MNLQLIAAAFQKIFFTSDMMENFVVQELIKSMQARSGYYLGQLKKKGSLCHWSWTTFFIVVINSHLGIFGISESCGIYSRIGYSALKQFNLS